LPDDIHQIDWDLRMLLQESLHLDEGIRGGRSGRAVLEHHQQVRRSHSLLERPHVR
jgi:hypothetical protein